MFDMLNYKKTLQNILKQSSYRKSRLGSSYEIVGLSLRFPSGQLFYKPGMLRLLGWFEAMQIASGNFNAAKYKIIAPNLKFPYKVNDSGYGIRLAPQMEDVVNQLQNYPETRRAIVHIGQPIDTGEKPKPCVDSYQWIVVGSQLDMIVSIRSWDLLTGFIYDTLVMGVLNGLMANILGYIPGIIHCHAGSGHIYEQDVATVPTVGEKEKYFELDERIRLSSWEDAVLWASINADIILSNPVNKKFVPIGLNIKENE